MTLKHKIILQVTLLFLVMGSLAGYLFYGTYRIQQRLRFFSPATHYLLGIADVKLGLAAELRTIWSALATGAPLDSRELLQSQDEVRKAFEMWLESARDQEALGVAGEAADVKRAENLHQLYLHWQQKSRQLLESGQATTVLAETARVLLEDQLFPGIDETIKDGVDDAKLAYSDLEDALGFFPWLQTSGRQRVLLIEADLNFVVDGNQVYALLNRQFAALQAYRVNHQQYDLSHFQNLFDSVDQALNLWHRQGVARLSLDPNDASRRLDLDKVIAVQANFALLEDLAQEILFPGSTKNARETLGVLVGQIEGLTQGSLRPAVLASMKSAIRSVQDAASAVNYFGVTLIGVLLLAIIVQAARSITALVRSLAELQVGISAFQQGDLAHRIQLRGEDEFSQLGSALNRMADQIQSSWQELRDQNDSLERRVADQTRRLEEFNQELRIFNSMVSRDLRNPLAAVLGLSEVLLERARNNGHGDLVHLQHIVTNAGRMDMAINALVSLSGVACEPLRSDAIDISLMARQICSGLQESAPDVQVEVQIESGLTAGGDPDLVRLALEKLLERGFAVARKAPSVCIAVGKQTTDGRDLFFIRDDGPGFPPEQVGDVFSRRWMASAQEGADCVDLAIVKSIILRHGGEIRVESLPATGTSFHFTLATSEVGTL